MDSSYIENKQDLNEIQQRINEGDNNNINHLEGYLEFEDKIFISGEVFEDSFEVDVLGLKIQIITPKLVNNSYCGPDRLRNNNQIKNDMLQKRDGWGYVLSKNKDIIICSGISKIGLIINSSDSIKEDLKFKKEFNIEIDRIVNTVQHYFYILNENLSPSYIDSNDSQYCKLYFVNANNYYRPYLDLNVTSLKFSLHDIIPATIEDLRISFQMIASGKNINTTYEMLISSRNHLFKKQFRSALFDVCTGFELLINFIVISHFNHSFNFNKIKNKFVADKILIIQESKIINFDFEQIKMIFNKRNKAIHDNQIVYEAHSILGIYELLKLLKFLELPVLV